MAGPDCVVLATDATSSWPGSGAPEQGVGVDEKAPPPCPGQTLAESSEDRTIGGPVPDTSADPPFENSHLVPQHHDLGVLLRFGPAGRDDEAEKPAHGKVEEGEDHGG